MRFNPIRYLQLAFAASREDSWSNVITGLGTARDKRTYTEFAPSTILDDQTLDNLYNEEDMAAKIANKIPEEALRKGFSVNVQDDDNPDEASRISEDIQSDLAELEAASKFTDAHVWSRVFGGSVILIGADDGASVEQMVEPLNEDRIRKITHLTVIEKRYVVPKKWYNDPMSPKFGYPETYDITNSISGDPTSLSSMEVHESRLIVFDGFRTTVQRRKINNGWGGSVLSRVNEVLQDFGVSWQAVGHLLTDGAQAVYKMKGLVDMVSSEDTNILQQRMLAVDLSRSLARAVLLDADANESFERQSFNFSGIDKILQMFVLRLSAAADIPATVLMGQSPAGENATGEADFQWYYNTIQPVQQNYIKPKLERLIELLLKSKEGPTKGQVPDDWNIIFAPLWTLTPLQEADMRLKVAQTDQIYANLGTLLPDEITLSRFRPEGWSMETTVDLDLRREVLAIEKDRELENAKNPPEPPPQLPPPPTNGQPPEGQQQDEPGQAVDDER